MRPRGQHHYIRSVTFPHFSGSRRGKHPLFDITPTYFLCSPLLPREYKRRTILCGRIGSGADPLTGAELGVYPFRVDRGEGIKAFKVDERQDLLAVVTKHSVPPSVELQLIRFSSGAPHPSARTPRIPFFSPGAHKGFDLNCMVQINNDHVGILVTIVPDGPFPRSQRFFIINWKTGHCKIDHDAGTSEMTSFSFLTFYDLRIVATNVRDKCIEIWTIRDGRLHRAQTLQLPLRAPKVLVCGLECAPLAPEDLIPGRRQTESFIRFMVSLGPESGSTFVCMSIIVDTAYLLAFDLRMRAVTPWLEWGYRNVFLRDDTSSVEDCNAMGGRHFVSKTFSEEDCYPGTTPNVVTVVQVTGCRPQDVHIEFKFKFPKGVPELNGSTTVFAERIMSFVPREMAWSADIKCDRVFVHQQRLFAITDDYYKQRTTVDFYWF